jgi:hypothetical protein
MNIWRSNKPNASRATTLDGAQRVNLEYREREDCNPWIL